MLLIVSLPHALMMSSDKKSIEERQFSEGINKCFYCAEFIKQDAIMCRYCKKDID